MNKRGTIFISVVSGIFIFLFGVLFISFISDEVIQTQSQNTSLFAIPEGGPALNCNSLPSGDNTTITDGQKLSCLGTELVIPYFIILIMAIAGGAIIGRFI